MPRHVFLVALVITTCAVFFAAAAVHNFQSVDLALLPTMARAKGKVLIFGNSVNRTVSSCDSDVRTLPDMLDALGDPRVVNVSRGGMQMSRMLRMAELSTMVGLRPSTIVFPIIAAELFQSADAPDGWDAFLKDNLPVSMQPDAVRTYQPPVEPENYRGRHYGTYAVFSSTYFVKEKRESGCPERLGVDPEFEAFIYWRSYLQPDALDAGLDRTIARAAAIRAKGVDVVFWIPPVDVDDLRSLHGQASVVLLQGRLERAVNRLASQSFDTIDTSTLVPGTGFADRWCACGHLNQVGRDLLARRLHADLSRR